MGKYVEISFTYAAGREGSDSVEVHLHSPIVINSLGEDCCLLYASIIGCIAYLLVLLSFNLSTQLERVSFSRGLIN